MLFKKIRTLEFFFFFSSRRRHTRSDRDWSSDVCSSDLAPGPRRTDPRRAPGVRPCSARWRCSAGPRARARSPDSHRCGHAPRRTCLSPGREDVLDHRPAFAPVTKKLRRIPGGLAPKAPPQPYTSSHVAEVQSFARLQRHQEQGHKEMRLLKKWAPSRHWVGGEAVTRVRLIAVVFASTSS